MKAKDINSYTISAGCYGKTIKIDSLDLEDIRTKEIIEFITDMLKNDVNSKSLIREIVEVALDYLQFDLKESEGGICKTCGQYGYTHKYVNYEV